MNEWDLPGGGASPEERASWSKKDPTKGDLQQEKDKAIRKLVHAAFHIMDDSTEYDSGRWRNCSDISQRDLKRMNEALDELGIESHEDIDRVFGAAPAEEEPGPTQKEHLPVTSLPVVVRNPLWEKWHITSIDVVPLVTDKGIKLADVATVHFECGHSPLLFIHQTFYGCPFGCSAPKNEVSH